MAMSFPTEAFDYVSTTPAREVGSRAMFRHATYGVVEAIYIYNGEASASIVQGDVVRAKTSTLSAGTGLEVRHHVAQRCRVVSLRQRGRVQHEAVCACTAREGVRACHAAQGVVTRPSRDAVGLGVARPAQRAAALI